MNGIHMESSAWIFVGLVKKSTNAIFSGFIHQFAIQHSSMSIALYEFRFTNVNNFGIITENFYKTTEFKREIIYVLFGTLFLVSRFWLPFDYFCYLIYMHIII